MKHRYEIDQLSKFYKGLCKDYSYIVITSLPYCSNPGPFRIVAKTLEQARAFKYRSSITKITMWPHKTGI